MLLLIKDIEQQNLGYVQITQLKLPNSLVSGSIINACSSTKLRSRASRSPGLVLFTGLSHP